MDLKALGLRFALGYLVSRAKGESQKNSAVDSLLGSTIAQAGEDVSGFTPEMADVTTQVVGEVIQGKRARKNVTLSPLAATQHEIRETMDDMIDPTVGLSANELEDEVAEIKAGIDEAKEQILRLERLKAGVLRRNS